MYYLWVRAIALRMYKSFSKLYNKSNPFRMETRTVKLLKILPNMSRQVKPTLVVEPKLREGGKDFGDSYLL